MCEILSRGKRVDNGEWVEGFLFVRKDTQGKIIETFIIVDAYEQITLGQRYVRSNLNQECFRVIPETVGRYTGLTANGKKIFEGDVLRYGLLAVPAVAVVKFGEYSFGSQFDMNCVGFYLEWTPRAKYYRTDLGFWVKQREIEIIGNVYDNPELLEVEE